VGFNFRIRFKFSDAARLPISQPTMILAQDGPLCVYMSSLREDGNIEDVADATLIGVGYSTVEEAQSAGARWRSVLHLSLARLNIGVDFGERSAEFEGGLSDFGVSMMAAHLGRPVLNERPGVLVYEDPRPTFFASSAHGMVKPSVRRMKGTFQAAMTLDDVEVTDAERLAYDLYAASFFERSADARLLMVMMAVETLIDPIPRSPEARGVVEFLIRHVEESNLPRNEIASMAGSLRWLENESIGQAGRRLASVLDGQLYSGMAPAKFFTKCYTLRSALVHGHLSRPSRSEVDVAASNLQLLVGQLLSRRLLHITDEWAADQGIDNELLPTLRVDVSEDPAPVRRSPWRTLVDNLWTLWSKTRSNRHDHR
jgi:hypothetical protein